MATFKCVALGMDCDYVAEHENTDELMKTIEDHVEGVHKEKMSLEMKQKVRRAWAQSNSGGTD